MKKSSTTRVLCMGFFALFHFYANAQSIEQPEFLERIGTIDSLYSKTLNEYREIYIQLPAQYNPEHPEKFPVVYILDGEVLLPTVHNVQSFYAGGFMPDMILVGISNAKNRTRDLTPSKVTTLYGMPYNEDTGGAYQFSTFIETELIPFIENKYPVTHFRTLIGHSYGGLFTLHMLLHHSQLFSNYIAIDPSIDWDNQKLLKEAQGLLSTNSYQRKSLFISLNGQLNMQDPTMTLENVMQDTSEFTLFPRSNISFSNTIKENYKNGLSYEWQFYPRDLHGTIAFPSIMDGLISTFKWFQMEQTDKFNSPNTSQEELSAIVKYRAKKLEDYFGYDVAPYPEDLLNALGYMSLDMEQLEKSKMFFEFAMQFYPNSPNTYDSMSEYYERLGDKKNALKFASKSYELNPNDYYKGRVESLKKG